MGMLKGKDIKGTLDELIPVASTFTFLSFPHPQAATAEKLMEYCNHDRKRVTNLKNGTIILDRDNDKKKIVTGSLYLLTGIIDY